MVSGRFEALALKTATSSVARGLLLAMLTGVIAVPAWAQVGPSLRLQEQTEQVPLRRAPVGRMNTWISPKNCSVQ